MFLWCNKSKVKLYFKDKAESKHLLDFFSNSHIYKIPEYQRKYTWTKEKQIRLFWDDLMNVHNNQKPYFFGTITYKYQGKDYILVDGQQRTTTFLLFFKALYDFNHYDLNVSKDEQFLKDIRSNMFKIEIGDRVERLKISDIENKEKFKRIFEDVEDKWEDLKKVQGFKTKSLYHANYFWFREVIYEEFNKNPNDAKRFYEETLKNLWIVAIKLNDSDDELTIFESINSKGSSLTTMDLIKNFLFIKSRDIGDELNSKLNSFFTKEVLEYSFLQTIKNDINKNEILSNFIRKFIIYQQTLVKDSNFKIVLPKEKDTQHMYALFKTIIEKNYNDLKTKNNFQALINDLEQMLNVHEKLFQWSHDDSNNGLSIVINLMYEELTGAQFFPFIMQMKNFLFSFNKDNTILEKTKEFDKVIMYLENFYIKRSVAGLGSRLLTRTVNKIRVSNLEDLKKELDELLPNYDLFQEQLSSVDVYKRIRPSIKHILWRIELENNKKDTFELLTAKQRKKSQVEHIMPQKIDDEEFWIKELDLKNRDDLDFWHSKLCNTLGNLTITLDNQKLSNKPFFEKKELLKQSSIEINRKIANSIKWNKEIIETRKEEIIKKACEIFYLLK